MVISPSTKSVGSAGIGGGSQRNWFGEVGTSSNGVLAHQLCAIGL